MSLDEVDQLNAIIEIKGIKHFWVVAVTLPCLRPRYHPVVDYFSVTACSEVFYSLFIQLYDFSF